MGIDSLRELELAGVKWELTENSHITDNPMQPDTTANSSQKNTKQPLEATIIPATAPIASSSAAEMAESVNSLDELVTAIINFEHPLKQFVTNVVRPHFAKPGDLLIITDIPSGDDDISGQILTNGAGELMNKMLSAIGLDRESVSIIPLLFWRTPGGRSPAKDELDLAAPFLKRAIDLLQPKAILTLGTVAAAEIADAKLPKNHGEVFETKDKIPLVPIFHPNYLMLKPDAKRDAWEALKKLQNLLKTAQETL